MTKIVYINNKYINKKDAKISIFDRGLLFADAVYEVTAVINGKLIDFSNHVTRLNRSLKELNINHKFKEEYLLKIHKNLIKKNSLNKKEALIYIQVSRGTMDRDFIIPKKKLKINLFAFTQEKKLTHFNNNGLKIISISDLRWKRRDIKTTQLIFASLSKSKAIKEGYDDAWMIDSDGYVNEGTSNNAYIIDKNNNIITRELSSKLLAGVTRKTILEVAIKLKLTIKEKPFTITEALKANEAFISSASNLILPVISINNNKIGNGEMGPITEILRETYIKLSLKNSV